MNLLLQAARETVLFQGVDQIGVKAIATRSGKNKVLVYRYFGGWNGIIEALFQQMLARVGEQGSEEADLAARTKEFQRWEAYIQSFYRELQTDGAFQILLRWQLDNQHTLLAQRLAGFLEQSLDEVASHAPRDSGIFQLLMAGVTYSALGRSQKRATPPDLIETSVRQVFGQLKPGYQPVRISVDPNTLSRKRIAVSDQ
ncbi:TetR/AcrR family transcriptional regulator [Spirosoma sp. KNUC1025]|uniref:TetR/AcrR family transcriptional regulator n=1 Tax=Spirosoma sp. KNUC1025 TaxID=2894082 RepID=UPI0038709CE0|nr:TetR/AcrR family transcriptional regulator [Spirosoma sp. KNUC1025]